MTKAQKARAADYRGLGLGLGYEIAGMIGDSLVVSRPLHNGRPGTCYQLIEPGGKTTRTFIKYKE
ncbi:MAG: hypothetical protein ACREA0_02410 [bacterium]